MHAYSRWDRPYRLKGLTSHERVDIPGHRAPADACATDRADGRPGGRRTPGGLESGGRRVPAPGRVPASGATERGTTEQQHPDAAGTAAAADRDPTRELCGDAEADRQADRGGHPTCE